MVILQFEQDGLLALGTLGNDTAINGQTKIDAARLNGFRVSKINATLVMSGKTGAEGPIIWGFSCNMNAAQVKAALEADPQSSPEDDEKGDGQYLKIAGLIPLGMTAGPLTSTGGAIAGASAHPHEYKINWSVIEGKTFDVWAYNIGAALTTGTLIRWVMEIFGVWLRD